MESTEPQAPRDKQSHLSPKHKQTKPRKASKHNKKQAKASNIKQRKVKASNIKQTHTKHMQKQTAAGGNLNIL